MIPGSSSNSTSAKFWIRDIYLALLRFSLENGGGRLFLEANEHTAEAFDFSYCEKNEELQDSLDQNSVRNIELKVFLDAVHYV